MQFQVSTILSCTQVGTENIALYLEWVDNIIPTESLLCQYKMYGKDPK